jgi:hypothetical protein
MGQEGVLLLTRACAAKAVEATAVDEGAYKATFSGPIVLRPHYPADCVS